MTRLNILLLTVLVLSALALVQTAYEGRRLFAEIEKAKAESARLASEHARLLAERQAQATNLRVERLARDRLQMLPVSPTVTHYVVDGGHRTTDGAGASSGDAPVGHRVQPPQGAKP